MSTFCRPARFFSIGTLIALLAACAPTAVNQGTMAAPVTQNRLIHGEMSDFVLKDIDGRTHALSDYLGKKVIVISFFATWCEPCKEEMSKLQELFDTHQNKGLIVLSISMDEPESQGAVRPFVKQRGFTFPVLLDSESQVTNQFNPRRAAPFNMIIDKQRRNVWSHEGYVRGDERVLEAAVLEALGHRGLL